MAILVVDDSRAMRMLVLRELRKAGHDGGGTIEAENGRDALDKLGTGSVDLIVSDWNMPDMSGIELLCELRGRGIDVPFGFVTSESSGEIRRKAIEAGASFLVVKPFQGDDLNREVSAALGAAQGIGEGGPVGGAPESLDAVLSGLLGREVDSRPCPPPGKEVTRAVARYQDTDGRTIYFVAEMAVAVAMGAALSRIPGRQAEEWSQSRAMPEAIQQNFHECANVLAKLAQGSGQARCSLQEVFIVVDLEDLPGFPKASDEDWDQSLKIFIDGYPSGAAGFIGSKCDAVAGAGAAR
jgi:CheY-like chemotaxis protein